MYKVIVVLFATFFIASATKAGAQDTTAVNQDTSSVRNAFTLEQCVEIAFKNNADVKQAELSARTAKINYDQAKANLLPDLNAGVSHTSYNGRSINPYTNAYINEQNTAASYQLTSGITLWNGSSLYNFMRQNKFNYEAGKMDAQNEKDKLTINIILAYLSVLSAQEQLNIAQKQLDATQKKVDLLNIKNNDGAISPSDLFDMKGQYANDGITVVSTKNSLEKAKQDLTTLMNIPYSENMKLAEISNGIIMEPYDETADQVYENASQRLAMIKSADFKVTGAARNISAIRGQMYPKITLSGGWFTNYSSAASVQQLTGTSEVMTSDYIMTNGIKTPVYTQQSNYKAVPIEYNSQLKNNVNSAISIGLQIPLTNNMQTRNRLRLAKVAQLQIKEDAQTARIQLRQAIDRDFVNLNADYSTYKLLLDQVSNYEQSFHAADIRFANGAISTVDYVIAKNNIDRVQLNLVAAKYNYILRAKIIDFYQNRPLW